MDLGGFRWFRAFKTLVIATFGLDRRPFLGHGAVTEAYGAVDPLPVAAVRHIWA